MSNRIENQIEREFLMLLKSGRFLKKYRQLRARYKELCLFESPKAVANFLHDRSNKNYQAKDKLFKILVIEYQKSRDSLVALYLLGLLFPGLGKVYGRYCSKLSQVDKEELFDQITTFCLKTAVDYDFSRRPNKVAKNIVMDTFGKTSKWFNRMIEVQIAETALNELLNPGPQVRPQVPVDPRSLFGSEEYDGASADLIVAKEVLLVLTEASIISNLDMQVILDTLILRKSLAAICGGTDTRNYERIKKRRQRAVNALWQHIERERREYAQSEELMAQSVPLSSVLRDMLQALKRDLH